jgi:carboxyl-terminal processing protease
MKKLYFLILLSSLVACKDSFFEPVSPKQPKAIFNELWSEFDALYAPFEVRNINWAALKQKYETQVDENASDEQLYQVLSAMLTELNDGHVKLTVPNKSIFQSNRYYRERIDDALFDTAVITKHYLKTPKWSSNQVLNSVEATVGDNILYVRYAIIGEEIEKLPAFFSEMKNEKGLIIDLRHNLGGDFTYALKALARMTDEKRLVFQSRTKNGKSKNDYTHWHDWHIVPEWVSYKEKIVLLTDRYTISAAERVVMMLRTLPNVTHIGDTTNGAIGTMIGRELSNGWFYSLVTQDVKAADGTRYEGKGIDPQIVIKNNAADLAKGKDRVLEKAIELLK